MASFAPILEHTKTLEGGYTVDQGGRTMWGITEAVLKEYQKTTGKFQGVTIRALTWPQAGEIYRARYWAPIKGDLLQSQNLAAALFDYSVNSGVGQAVKDLQRVLKGLGYYAGEIDGGFGPATLAAAQKGGERAVSLLMARRRSLMEYLAKKDPARHGASLKGWLKRLERLQGFFNVAARPAGAGFVLALGAAAFFYWRKKRGSINGRV